MAVSKKTTNTSNVGSIGKLQFDILTNTKKVLEAFEKLPEAVEKVKEQVKEIEENFAYQIQEKEIENNDKKAKLDEALAEYNKEIDAKKQELNDGLVLMQKENTRKVEELTYEHNLAIRDKKLSTAIAIAKEQSKVVVDKSEYDMLVNTHVMNETEKETLVRNTVDELNAKHNEYTNTLRERMESQHKLELMSVKKDNESLVKELAIVKEALSKAEKTIADLNRNIVEVSANASKPNTIIQERK